MSLPASMTAANFVTETNKAPLVQILTLFFLSCALVCTLARVYTKWVVIPFVALDDYFLPISAMFLTAESIAVTVMTSNGYGQPAVQISPLQQANVLKAQYAAMLLYVPSLLFSKLPTLALLDLISPKKRLRKVIVMFGILITAWTITSEIVYAFQCKPADTWNYIEGQCMDLRVFTTYFEAMNAFTDVILILLPAQVVVSVNTTVRRKFDVLSIFSVRLVSVAAIVTKLVLLWNEADADPFFGTWPVTVLTQLIQFLSLMAACFLYLRPFLEALTSGFINGDDLRRRGQIRPYIIDAERYSDEPSSSLTKDAARSKEEYLESGMVRYPISQYNRAYHAVENSGTFLQSQTESEKMESAATPWEYQQSPRVPYMAEDWPLTSRAVKHRQAPRSIDVTRATQMSDHQRRDETAYDDRASSTRSPIASQFERVSTDDRAMSLTLPLPNFPVPIGRNGLPRVSQVYTPLTNSDNLQSFLTEDDVQTQMQRKKT